MAINPQRKFSPAEYLAFERAQTDIKHEYLDGEITAMAGGSREHNRIVSNVMGILYNQLRGRPCDHYGGDMRVKVAATGLYVYPDITALCDDPQFEDDVFDTLLNPSVIIEVLSETTEAYDRGTRFDHYRSIESLRVYGLIAQDKPQIELFERQTQHWLLSVAKGLETSIRLEVIECELALADVYERVI